MYPYIYIRIYTEYICRHPYAEYVTNSGSGDSVVRGPSSFDDRGFFLFSPEVLTLQCAQYNEKVL